MKKTIDFVIQDKEKISWRFVHTGRRQEIKIYYSFSTPTIKDKIQYYLRSEYLISKLYELVILFIIKLFGAKVDFNHLRPRLMTYIATVSKDKAPMSIPDIRCMFKNGFGFGVMSDKYSTILKQVWKNLRAKRSYKLPKSIIDNLDKVNSEDSSLRCKLNTLIVGDCDYK